MESTQAPAKVTSVRALKNLAAITLSVHSPVSQSEAIMASNASDRNGWHCVPIIFAFSSDAFATPSRKAGRPDSAQVEIRGVEPMTAMPTMQSEVWQGAPNTIEVRHRTTERAGWCRGVHHLFGVR